MIPDWTRGRRGRVIWGLVTLCLLMGIAGVVTYKEGFLPSVDDIQAMFQPTPALGPVPVGPSSSTGVPPLEPRPTPGSAPVPTPMVSTKTAHALMLDLINEARQVAGVTPVVLGDNAAAQTHAEASVEHCFSGHWGMDGLKSKARYNLAGGFQYTKENVSGYSYCAKARRPSVESVVRAAMQGLMASPDHRKNILDPNHRKVNLGFALNDEGRATVVQQFEGDYVVYAEPPRLERTELSMSGFVRNGPTSHTRADVDGLLRRPRPAGRYAGPATTTGSFLREYTAHIQTPLSTVY